MKAGGLMIAASAILVLATASTGCMSGNDSTVTDVSPKGWDSPAGMVYTNRDTISKRRTVLFLRHDQRTGSGEYAVEFRTPSGEIVKLDTISVELPKTNSFSISMVPAISISTSMSRRLSYLRPLRLAEEGDYAITVTPLQITGGVWNVGISFNKMDEE